jgi:hypothetical protein
LFVLIGCRFVIIFICDILIFTVISPAVFCNSYGMSSKMSPEAGREAIDLRDAFDY